MTISSWRRLTRATKVDFQEEKSETEINIPNHFRCPISLDLMKDPVILSSGITYDRENIERWVEAGNKTCPVTNQVLQSFGQIPNHAIRKMIQSWCVDNHSNGVERIPTPRIPVTLNEVFDVCSKIMVTTRRRDQKKCTELVKKMKRWALESEKNKKCIIESGACFILSSCFETFSSISVEENEGLLGVILSILPLMFPLGLEEKKKLSSPSSLSGMAWFLKGGDLSLNQNVVLILRELFSLDRNCVDTFSEIEGVDKELVRIIKQQVCPKATKAALVVIYHMISSTTSNTSEKITSLVELGLIPLVLEMIISSEKSICEKALGVLDRICSYKLGLEKAREHKLSLATCVKKIIRVSNMATEFSVSILWKLLKSEDGFYDHLIEEALYFGAFPKLLVVLQVGCGEKTKTKTTELLKLLNQHKVRLGCSDALPKFK